MVADDASRRPRRHHHDPVGKSDRLVQIVRDEQHRLAVRGPEVEEQGAHDLAGLRVKGPEGLVHEQDFGVADQHLCQATRLRWPPESCADSAPRRPPGRRAEPRRARSSASPRGVPRPPGRWRHCRARTSRASGRPAGRGSRPAVERRRALAEDSTVPDAGRSKPAAAFSKVDLPHPVGPTMATNSLSATRSETGATRFIDGRAVDRHSGWTTPSSMTAGGGPGLEFSMTRKTGMPECPSRSPLLPDVAGGGRSA